MKRIIGCGNLLLKDEGVGVHLIEYLKKSELPAGVELIDGACGGFDLLSYFDDAEQVVIVDAMQAPDGSPGNVYRFTPEDFETDSCPSTSLHDITLKDVFRLVRKTCVSQPRIVVFGVEPAEIGWGMELTDRIRELLPRLKELVIKECS